MREFENAHTFVDGFFAALAAKAPQSNSLKSSRDVVDSCLRLGEAIGMEKNPDKAEELANQHMINAYDNMVDHGLLDMFE